MSRRLWCWIIFTWRHTLWLIHVLMNEQGAIICLSATSLSKQTPTSAINTFERRLDTSPVSKYRRWRKRRRTSWQRQTACDLPLINTQRWAALCHSVQSSIHTHWQEVTHTMLHKVWQMQICGSKKLIQSSTLWPSQQRQPSRVCVCVCVWDNYSWACRTAWLTVCWDKLIFNTPHGFPSSFSATRVSQVFSCHLPQCHSNSTRLLFAALEESLFRFLCLLGRFFESFLYIISVFKLVTQRIKPASNSSHLGT